MSAAPQSRHMFRELADGFELAGGAGASDGGTEAAGGAELAKDSESAVGGEAASAAALSTSAATEAALRFIHLWLHVSHSYQVAPSMLSGCSCSRAEGQ